MGWVEDIFVMRNGIPIAYLSYKRVYLCGELPKEEILEENFTHDETSVKTSGKAFKDVLTKYSEQSLNGREQYIIDYFMESKIENTDDVFIYGG